MVIFGAAGDLTKRKLIPALYNLKKSRLLSDNFAVIGVARAEMDDEEFRRRLEDEMREFATDKIEANEWKWLEEQLKVPAEFRIIGSGVQILADEHGSEMWGNFPRERLRLLRLIRETKADGVVIISGDRHLSEISRLAADRALGPGYPLFDVTSSSLNTPSGNFSKAGVRFANEINSYRVGLTYFDVNFGAIQIDWDQPDPVVRLQVRDEKGGVVMQQRLALSQLRPRQPKP